MSNPGVGDQGFSLIELLAAVAILGIIAVPMVALFTQAHGASFQGATLTRLTNICRGVLEEVRAQVSRTGSYSGELTLQTPEGIISTIEISENNGLVSVTVTTSDRHRSVSLSTLVYYEP